MQIHFAYSSRHLALLRTLCFLVLFCAAASPCGAAKHALLVGVTELQYSPAVNWLQGPANDVVAMQQLLVQKYGFDPANIEVLTGRDATRANIEKAFIDRLVTPVHPGDLAVFFFSGHGTQVPDVPPLDEADKLDEALVPADAHSVETLLIDDDIGKLLARVPCQDILVLLDACHSGTGTRGGARSKYLSPQSLGIIVGTGTRGDAPLVSKDTVGSDLTGPTVLSAAAAEQVAADYPFLQRKGGATPSNPYMGALTFFTLKALREDASGEMSYDEIMKAVQASLQQAGFEQSPQLEGFTHRAALRFDGEQVPKPAATVTTTVTAVPTVATVQVSAVEGPNVTLQATGGTRLVKGSVFEAASSKDFVMVDDEPAAPAPAPKEPPKPAEAAQVRITAVDGSNAEGRLLRGAPRVGDRMVEVSHFIADEKLRLALPLKAGAPKAAINDLKQRLARLDFVQIVAEDELGDADLEVEPTAAGLRLAPYRNQQRLPEISGADVDSIFPKTASVVENLYLLKQFAALQNPNAAFKADVQVNGKDTDSVAINSQITFTARVEREAYVYLIDVDPAGKVTVLFPNSFVPDNRLQAGVTYKMPAPALYKLRVAGPAGPEIVKMIATERPLKLDVLAGDGNFTPLTVGATEVARSLLQQLKREINRNSTRGIVVEAAEEQPISTEGWATDTVLLQVHEQAGLF